MTVVQPRRSLRSRRRLIVAGALGAAVLTVGTFLVSGDGGGDTTASASQVTATTSIRQQDLVETEEVDGTLGYSDLRTVVNRLAGTVTWTPRAGSVVKINQRLYQVDGSAVYLLDGSFPAYRTLRAGLTGPDVRQLERNLRRLGLDAARDMKVDGVWGRRHDRGGQALAVAQGHAAGRHDRGGPGRLPAGFAPHRRDLAAGGLERVGRRRGRRRVARAVA